MSAPYRCWALEAPFTKKGWPVVGTFGATTRLVVIFDVETFKRLIRENPALAAVQFEMGQAE